MGTQTSDSPIKPIIVIIRSGGFDVDRGGVGGDTMELYGSSRKNAKIDIKDQTQILATTEANAFGGWKVLLNGLAKGEHRFVAGDQVTGIVSEDYLVGNLAPPQ